MEWEYKIFRDIIHGYIEVPKPFVALFIDTPIFQRLRNIEQTGMRVLYPSARHDRFIHSLGTFHLGKKAFSSLKRNIKSKNVYFSIKSSTTANNLFWNKYEVLFQIACLMHDCAHAPFSHTLEYMYDLKSDLSNRLVREMKNKAFAEDAFHFNPKEHERMSGIIIKRYYADAIEKILSLYIYENGVSKTELNKCIEFIVRAITGIKYLNKVDIEHQLLNCFISLLNSNIDVDGLDYIVRDSKLSGIDNYSVDIERLLGAVNIIEVTDLENHLFDHQLLDNVVLQIDSQKLATFTGALDGVIQGAFKTTCFTGSLDGCISIEGYGRFSEAIEAKNKAVPPTAIITGNTYTSSNITMPGNNVQFSLKGNCVARFQSNDFTSENDFSAVVESDNISFSASSIKIKAYVTGKFTGRILGRFGGRDSKITIGYHKSSLSVIENVMYARNYEYLWIYGHHKVAYYSNYLIKELLHQASNIILKLKDSATLFPDFSRARDSDEVISKLMSISAFSDKNVDNYSFLINDNDILAFLKSVFYWDAKSTNPNVTYQRLYDELQTRIYKKSVWKSPAEFNIMLSELSQGERDILYSHLIKNDVKKRRYGAVPDEWQAEFTDLGMDDVVWVDGAVTLKTVVPDETFILMKDSPVRFRDAVLNIGSQNSMSEYKHKGFYLYYDGKQIGKSELEKISSFLSLKAKEYALS